MVHMNVILKHEPTYTIGIILQNYCSTYIIHGSLNILCMTQIIKRYKFGRAKNCQWFGLPAELGYFKITYHALKSCYGCAGSLQLGYFIWPTTATHLLFFFKVSVSGGRGGEGALNFFFGRYVPRVFPKVGSRERIFFEKLGALGTKICILRAEILAKTRLKIQFFSENGKWGAHERRVDGKLVC